MNFKPPPHISNSQLSQFKRSPAHWLHYVTEPRKQTEAMILGSVCHCLALRPQDFDKEYFLMDTRQRPVKDKDFRTKANAEWKDEQIAIAGKLPVIDQEAYETAKSCVEALQNDPVASKYLAGEKEATIEWDSVGLHFKGIRDISAHEYIVDLKFVNNAEPYAFQGYMKREGLYRQGGMYLDGEMGGNFTGDPHKRVFFIAVETVPPYGVSVHELDYEVIIDGVNEYRRLGEQLKDCIANGFFPSYSFRSINETFDFMRPNFMPTE